MRTRIPLLAAIAVTALLDLGVKLATVAWFSTPVDLGPLTLRYVHNEGVAFSLGRTVPTPLLILLTSAVTVLLAVLAWRGVLAPQVAAGMIVAGAACNTIDRAIGGSVIDTFAVGGFAVFNVADAALDVGLVIVLVYMLWPDRDRVASPEEGAAPDER